MFLSKTFSRYSSLFHFLLSLTFSSIYFHFFLLSNYILCSFYFYAISLFRCCLGGWVRGYFFAGRVVFSLVFFFNAYLFIHLYFSSFLCCSFRAFYFFIFFFFTFFFPQLNRVFQQVVGTGSGGGSRPHYSCYYVKGHIVLLGTEAGIHMGANLDSVQSILRKKK